MSNDDQDRHYMKDDILRHYMKDDLPSRWKTR